MRAIPPAARIYLLIAAFLIAAPSLAGLYKGHTGRLLVAMPRIDDGSIFHRSVVYVVRHDLFHAYGYIVNVPLEGESPIRIDYPAYAGGPLEATTALMFAGSGDDGALVFSSAPQGLGQVRGLFGYAGWGPLQLDYEIARDGWKVIDSDPVLLLETPSADVWPEARRRAGTHRRVGDDRIL